jgi:hypothetical protein
MSERLSGGPIFVADNDINSINDVLRRIQDQLDEIRGLRGRALVFDRVQVSDPTDKDDAVDLETLKSGTQTLTNKTLSGAVITGAAPATPTANVLYADLVPKAWVKTSGGGAWTIDGDVNVSSILDNGAGDPTINFATAIADTNFAALCTVIQGALPSDRLVAQETARSTTSVRFLLENSSGVDTDPDGGISVLIMGSQ